LMKRTALICIIAACAALAGVAASASDASPGYDYAMGFHFSSVGGKSSSFYYEIATTVAELAVAETGFKVEIKRFPSNEAVTEAFKANKIDGGLLDNGAIMEIIESGGEVYPWATYVIGKDRKNKLCVWNRKKETLMSLADLEGKSLLWGATGYFGYLEFRDHLASKGIDKPLWKVFKSFTVAPNPNTTFMMLAKGDGDIAWSGIEADSILKVFQPDVRSQLSYGFCTEAVHNRGMIAINPKTVKKEHLAKATPILKESIMKLDKHAKTHPQLRAPIEYTKMIKMKFIPASADEYAYELALYKKAKKLGWVDEAKYLSEQLQKASPGKPVTVKPDMKYCKKKCGAAGASCVMSCMD
ncbi:MAG TPA: PhnD/SsuA/transferrin family substrate-binding protein, partial [bacterium]|nr:PhnD/SsuA/transferrin family substrate-binding protein [bacterium]HPN95537.1 PhnD/SsuA/transferrin family substrate-binding protein [bacterium]